MKLSSLLAIVGLSVISATAAAQSTSVPYSLNLSQPRTDNYHFDTGQPCSIHYGSEGGEGSGLTAPYVVVQYQVTVAGSYNFYDTGYQDNGGPDGSMGIYSGSFDPANPMTNCVASVDDESDVVLAPGVYTFVLTSLDGLFDVPGIYLYTITGPAALQPYAGARAVAVPTVTNSTQLAMLLLMGVLGAGAVSVRKRWR